MKSETTTESEFSGREFSDERRIGKWKSRYSEKEAKSAILFEAVYTATLLFICPIFITIIWLAKADIIPMPLSDGHCSTLCRYAYAWFGGLFGGVVYSTKWLYHSVAHGIWNIDRKLWRFLSPHLSAALAVAFIWMIDSELLSIFDGQSVQRTQVVLATSFLVGYFSDRAAAKMSEIANILFGLTSKASSPSKAETDEEKTS